MSFNFILILNFNQISVVFTVIDIIVPFHVSVLVLLVPVS